MVNQKSYRGVFFFVVFLWMWTGGLVILPGSRPAWAQQTFTTQRAKIVYQDPAQLEAMERRLRLTPVAGFSQSYQPVQKAGEVSFPQLAAKIDGLLVKVSQILSMPLPAKQKPLRIFLLADAKEVGKMYVFLNPGEKSSIFGYGSMEAFYEPKSRSIFISLRDLHEGVLGHEMGHHVLCTVPRVPLAEVLQEELCRNLETRIF